MMLKGIRKLSAREIDVRVARCGITAKGSSWAQLLLYMDGRVPARILDEAVGALNWQVSYSNGNANCTISIWDEAKSAWISKENVGTASAYEAEKGLASDSFKRAATYWGIGRELYSAGEIWTRALKVDKDQRGIFRTNDKFSCQHVGYDKHGDINELIIWNDTQDICAYELKAEEVVR